MKQIVLTPAQSIEARENLNLQQPVVVSGVKAEHPDLTFTKTYLSEFESGVRNLPLKTLRAMRDFYESEGHEFTDEPEAEGDLQPGDQVRVIRDAIVVCDRLTHSQRGAIHERIRDLLAGLQADLLEEAGAGIFDLYDEETDLARDQAIAVLAEVGVLYTLLFDNCVLEMPSEVLLNAPRKAETISEVVALRFFDALRLVERNSRGNDGSKGASGVGSGAIPALDGDAERPATAPAVTKSTGGVILFG